MRFTKREHLTVIKVTDGKESVTFEDISELLFEAPSNIIYCCDDDDRLVGIISMGDVARARAEGRGFVEINTKFTSLQGFEYMKARKIFLENDRINALPVVAEDHKLFGDYSRWNDVLSGYSFDYLPSAKNAGAAWQKYKNIAIVLPANPPCESEQIIRKCSETLTTAGCNVRYMGREEIKENFDSQDAVLFFDENELRGIGTLYAAFYNEELNWSKACTLQSFGQKIKNAENEASGDSFLRSLKDSGVHVYNLCFEKSDSTYWENFEEELKGRLKAVKKKPSKTIPKEFYEDFFDDTYADDFTRELLTDPHEHIKDGFLVHLKDRNSRYFNVVDGERVTVGQPVEYDQTLYLFGPCIVVGAFTKDEHTIASYLQKLLNASGRRIRVVNCGCWGKRLYLLARIIDTEFKKGDIAIVYDEKRRIDGIPSINLCEILEQEEAPVKWFYNVLEHANYKGNELYAKYIYNTLLDNNVFEKKSANDENVKLSIQELIWLYYERHFRDFDNNKMDKTVGAIVMNCNPFTKGHKYLIDKAAKEVDTLVVFVVEEDKSLFSFDERFAMVVEGTKDIKNVRVVPSGDFVMSQETFPEYFVKIEDKELQENVEFDIRLFAEVIAPKLNIKYRFAGEEKYDSVTGEYNAAMRRILPQYGIEFVEFPRLELEGDNVVISASAVRSLLEKGDLEKVKSYVPDSTMKILKLTDCDKN